MLARVQLEGGYAGHAVARAFLNVSQSGREQKAYARAIRDQHDCDERAFKEGRSLAHAMCGFLHPFFHGMRSRKANAQQKLLVQQVCACGQAVRTAIAGLEDHRATVIPCAL